MEKDNGLHADANHRPRRAGRRHGLRFDGLTITAVDSDADLDVLVRDQGRDELTITQVVRVEGSRSHVEHQELCAFAGKRGFQVNQSVASSRH